MYNTTADWLKLPFMCVRYVSGHFPVKSSHCAGGMTLEQALPGVRMGCYHVTFEGIFLVEIFAAILTGIGLLFRVGSSVCIKGTCQGESFVANLAVIGTFS